MVSGRLVGGGPATAQHIAGRPVRSAPDRKIAIPTGRGSGWGARGPPALSISINSSNLVRHGKRRRRAARFGSTGTTQSPLPSPIRRGGSAGSC